MSPTQHPEFLQTLRAIVGAANVLTEGDLSAWERDWRKREQGRALAVVRPSSTEEVARVVQACAAAHISLVPQGGNTGMVVGSTPDATGNQVLLSLTRMNRIRKLDAANLTVTVEAGCVLQTLQETCEAAGFLYPLSMASEGSCTVGGNLGTNAGGTQVVRYGNTRELCLGLEVVTATGEVWDGLLGLRKDNTGYDLRHLFIGSEGTLGVITAATMKLFPMPKAMMTAYASVPSLDAAVELLGLAHQHLSAGLTGFEVMGAFALRLVRKHFPALQVPFAGNDPFCVVLELSDHDSETHARHLLESLLEQALQNGCVLDAVVAENISQARALWHIRESIPLAQAQEGLNIKHDISIAVSRIPDFVRETDAAIQQAFPRRTHGQLRPSGRRQPALQRAGPGGCRCRGLFARPGKTHERAGLCPDRPLQRLDFGRARHWQPEAREAGRAQIARRSGPDARHQTRARPAQFDEPRTGIVPGNATILGPGIACIPLALTQPHFFFSAMTTSQTSRPVRSQYEDFMRHVFTTGVHKADRTGTGTRSAFGYQMRFDLNEGFPLVTTKKVHLRSIIQELLWFLTGSSSNNWLKERGVSIWDEWAKPDGDLGPVYGVQWRSWPTPDGGHIDQITELVNTLKTNPDSRRMIVSAWNVADLSKMALMPCHAFFQFYVAPASEPGGKGRLSCQLYQRSADIFLGVPFNIASYALLTHMLAQQCNLEVGDFIWTGGDCHIYSNHHAQVEEQLSRAPFSYPTLHIKRQPASIFDYQFEDFEVLDYQSHPAIKAPVAV